MQQGFWLFENDSLSVIFSMLSQLLMSTSGSTTSIRVVTCP